MSSCLYSELNNSCLQTVGQCEAVNERADLHVWQLNHSLINGKLALLDRDEAVRLSQERNNCSLCSVKAILCEPNSEEVKEINCSRYCCVWGFFPQGRQCSLYFKIKTEHSGNTGNVVPTDTA